MGLDLITLAEYKSYAKIVSADQDDRLNLLIPMVSEFVKTYCGRTFVDYASTATTEYSSNGGFFVYTKEQPIITVSSVATRASPIDGYITLTDGVDYVVDRQNDYIYCINDVVDGFPSGPNSIKIVYKGGYVSEPPADLKLGIIHLLDFYVKKESMLSKALNSNQVSLEFTRTHPNDLPPHIKRVFELYRIH